MSLTAAAPLLKPDDLDDPEQFVEVGPIPYLDIHEDPTNGKVDEEILRLIRDNNNRRSRKGLLTALILGHTKLPIRAGDHMPDELEQPEVVGYAGNWFIAPDPVEGKPCLWATEWHLKRYVGICRGMPYRSIERLSPSPDKSDPKPTDHYADRVSLLRTPPRREFPPIHYGGDPVDMVRFAYGRVAPATEPTAENDDPKVKEENTDMGFDHTDPAHVEKLAELLGPHIGRYVRDQVRSALQEMVEAAPGEAKEAPPVAAETPVPGDEDTEAKAPVPASDEKEEPNVLPPDDEEDGNDVDGDGVDDEDEERDQYGELEQPTDEDMDDEYEGDPDDIGEDVEEEEQVPRKQRAKYAEAELGGDNGIVPSMVNGKPKKKDQKVINRKQYQKDMGAVATTIEDLYSQIGQLAHERNRLLYQKKLSALKEEGFELDVDEEANELPIADPEEFMTKRESHIRKNYRRTIINQTPVPVAEKTPAREPMNHQQMIRARGYATANRVSFDDAVKALGFNI